MPPDLINIVSQKLNQLGFPEKDTRYIAGVSGGVDSMVLLFLLAVELNYPVVAAHVNYGKRGKESDRDEALVNSFCEKHQIPLEICNLQKIAEEKGDVALKRGNFQAEAREIRRSFLEKVMKNSGARAIFLAHHKEDQTETILQKILRGAAPEFWGGMQDIDGPWVRPLLCQPKAALVAFADYKRIPYRTDRSNLKSEYARNLLRNKIFPLWDTPFPGWQENVLNISHFSLIHRQLLDHLVYGITTGYTEFQDSSSQLSDTLTGEVDSRQHLLSSHSKKKLYQEEPYAKSFCSRKETRTLCREKWLKLPEPLQISAARHWIRLETGFNRWNRGEIENLNALKHIQTGQAIRIGNAFTVIRDREAFICAIEKNRKNDKEEEITIVLEEVKKKEKVISGLKIKKFTYQPDLKKEVLQLAWEHLPEKIILRKWKRGDRMQPFGMIGTQLISDHLANRKISSVTKNEARVLLSFDGNILAVIFPHSLPDGQIGTIAASVRCQKDRQSILLIKKTTHEFL